jgi:hypothetical protein
VFPKTVVGDKSAKRVSISHGFVLRDEATEGISLGDYTKRNFSTNDQPDPSASLFRMEPGRCLSQQVYGVSKAHVSAKMGSLPPVCVKRESFGDFLSKCDLFFGLGYCYSPTGTDTEAY